jgi:hypothetical protein
MQFDVFAPLVRASRRAHREAYRRFVLRRNGRFDSRSGRFVRLDELRSEGPPPSSSGLVDAELLEAQYRSFDARKRTPGAALPLLAIVNAVLVDERRETSAIGAFSLFPSTDVIRHRLNGLLPEHVRLNAYLA